MPAPKERSNWQKAIDDGDSVALGCWYMFASSLSVIIGMAVWIVTAFAYDHLRINFLDVALDFIYGAFGWLVVGAGIFFFVGLAMAVYGRFVAREGDH